MEEAVILMQVEPPQLLLLILTADQAPGMLLKFKLHMQVLAEEDLLTVPLQLLFQQILMAEGPPPLRAPALARKLTTSFWCLVM